VYSNYSDSLSTTPRISVIIPTLGRYDYIGGALDSLLNQTIVIHEVIVIDQNPPEARQPKRYEGYEKINLKIIWQNERGQSLARNTGLSTATGEYVFMFDDDSIAYPDLLKRHLEPVLSGKYDVSTGVALPPSPTSYSLPKEFQNPRLSQTFDTGNSLMRLELIRRIGGLDRNFDFGPGADADLGIRLYLAGYRILHNPQAIRIHFKAPGGLRIHGVHKYNTDLGLLHPYPPVTQSYLALRYLTRRQQQEFMFLGFLMNKFPTKEIRQPDKMLLPKLLALLQFLIGMVLMPIKRRRSLRKAHALLREGVRLGFSPRQTQIG
jgi:glycosyltransferase involved in cell wall biosynthesis